MRKAGLLDKYGQPGYHYAQFFVFSLFIWINEKGKMHFLYHEYVNADKTNAYSDKAIRAALRPLLLLPESRGLDVFFCFAIMSPYRDAPR